MDITRRLSFICGTQKGVHVLCLTNVVYGCRHVVVLFKKAVILFKKTELNLNHLMKVWCVSPVVSNE